MCSFASPSPRAAPLSFDLRARIVAAAVSDTEEAVADRFHVGRATVQRLVARQRAGSDLATKPHGGGPGRLAPPAAEAALAEWLADAPSLTHAEIAGRLARLRARPVSRQTAQRTLRRMGYTRKKALRPSPQDRPHVAAYRAAFRAFQPSLGAERLVFVDERGCAGGCGPPTGTPAAATGT